MRVEQIVPGVYRLEKVLDWGFATSMHLLTLADGGVLVYSPTWCGDGTFEAVEGLGPVRAIVVPNHFHHLSLGRLERKGHTGLGDVVELAPLVPDGARVIAAEHMKTGEAWLVWPAPDGPALLVCDAFFHMTRPLRGLGGWTLRRMKIAPGLCFGWTTKRWAITDADAFREWATATVDAAAPRWLVPCHGEVLHDDAIAARIRALLDVRLG